MHLAALAPFTARDGENLAVYDWPLDAWDEETQPDPAPPRAVVLIVHGLGEHAGRYGHVARQLTQWGFAVRTYDQRGHGESGGARGTLPAETALLDDLAEVVDDTRLRSVRLVSSVTASVALQKSLPLILLGHSLGGLVASHFVALKIRPVEGLVMSSPALDAGLGNFQKLVLRLGCKLAPNLCFGNGLDTRYISHDKRVVKAYLADRQVHNRMSSRLGQFIASAGPATVAAARNWTVPTLLMYAGSDRLVSPQGSEAFAANAIAPGVKPGTVTARCFHSLYHELFNEVDAAAVFDMLGVWLDARF